MHNFIRSLRGIGACALTGWSLIASGFASQARADTAGSLSSDQSRAGSFVELLPADDSVAFGATSIPSNRYTSPFVPDTATGFDAGITPVNPAENIQPGRSAPVAVPLPRTWEMGVVGLLVVAGFGSKLSRRILL